MLMANEIFALGRMYWRRGDRGAAIFLVLFWALAVLILCGTVGTAAAAIVALIYPVFSTNLLMGTIFVILLGLLLFGAWQVATTLNKALDIRRQARGGYLTEYYSKRLRQAIHTEVRKEMYYRLRQRS